MVIYFSAIKGSLIRNKGDIVPMAMRKPSDLSGKPIASKSPKDYDPVLTDVRPPAHKPSSPSRKRRPFEFVHILLFLWGVGVLGYFLFSMRVGNLAEDVGCVLSRRPWLSSVYWCYLVNVSCARNHVVGRRYELQGIFSHLVRDELQELIISECAELEMPSQIQDFSNIHLVLIYNSTIAAWDMDAALIASAHPFLMSISVVETKLTAIPPALLHPDLPPVLTDIAFSGTNLTTIPDNVHEFWTSVFKLTLEASPGVMEFPPSFSDMSWVNQLSLVGNSISTIETECFIGSMFSTLDLSENPLLTLPVSLGANFGMGSLSIKMTGVSNIPSEWLETYAEISGWMVSASGSPLCGR